MFGYRSGTIRCPDSGIGLSVLCQFWKSLPYWNACIMDEEKKDDELRYGIVNLVSRYVPTEEDKRRYQCADVISQVIEFETCVEGTLRDIIDAIHQAEQHDRGSEKLTRLKTATIEYCRELAELSRDIEVIRKEHVTKVLAGHGLDLNKVCYFEVSGYQFSAVPVSEKMNYNVSDLFTYGEIANFNMPLSNVRMNGNMKARKGNIPSTLMVALWLNHEENYS